MTRIQQEVASERRYTLLQVLLSRVEEPYYEGALERRGYRIVEDSGRLSL